MVKINQNALRKLTKEIAEKERVKVSNLERKQEIEDFIFDSDNSRINTMLSYLLKRFETEGDAFQKVTGYGQLAEAISGIYLGIYTTEKDIQEFTVFDTVPYWEKGDLVLIDRFNRRIDLQVKGKGGNLSLGAGMEVPSNVVFEPQDLNNLGFLKESMTKKKKADYLKRSLIDYLNNSPANIRIVSPIYQNPLAGVFDMGRDTFISLADVYPSAFTFRIPVKTQIDKELFGVSLIDIAADWQRNFDIKDKQVIAFISKLTGSSLEREHTALRTVFKKIVTKARIERWRIHGKIQFNFSSALLAQKANPLINTGIKRYENHQPFYNVLDELFGANSLGKYLQEEPTLANKLPNAYYYNIYKKLNY